MSQKIILSESDYLKNVSNYIKIEDDDILKAINNIIASKTDEYIKYTSNYIKSQNSFSGADIVATVTVDAIGATYTIGELQTISYSIHRPKVQVRTLGRVNPSGIAKGTRTIAGSLIFTVFDRNIVKNILSNATKNQKKAMECISMFDEMPPFDITITFSNETGIKSKLIIKGVEIVNEGQTMSVEDIITENIYNYVAQDIYIMDTI